MTDLKHMILITDGDDQGSKDYKERVTQAYATGNITFSSILVGPDDSNMTADLREMAQNGHGNFYHAANALTLPDTMREETEAQKVQAGDYYNDRPFQPVINAHTPAVAGLVSPLPVLGGYYGTVAKDGATVILKKDGDPIYAEHTYGAGRVGSFMSDLSGVWSDAYFTESAGAAFINQAVRSLFPDLPVQTGLIRATFVKQNYTTVAKIDTDITDGGTIAAIAVSPDGKSAEIELTRLSDNSCQGAFTTDTPGLYAVTIIQKNRNGAVVAETTTYCAFSYSAEYDAFRDGTEGFAFVESIAANGGGASLFGAEGIFDRKTQTIERDYDPRAVLLTAAVALFLLDIVARKFKFKWPHEWGKDKKLPV
jgi:hypothetical protein